MKFVVKDVEDLKFAKSILENPSLAIRMINVLGIPFGKGLMILPEKWSGHIQKITEKALQTALNAALITMNEKPKKKSSEILHKIVAAASGGAGGLFGIPALSIELPISTTIMLRSIADIARSEGENVNDIETKLACIEVFAFGGRSESDDESEVGYYAIRAALTKAISDAAKYIAEKGVTKKGAPILVKLIAMIASRFGVVVSEKLAASAIPIVGAVGGALINTIFIDHFQDMARGHFIIRRLERVYGRSEVEAKYKDI
ncbi:MAG: EcsC family protein [Desulfobacterales bacterium]|nr:EcsC family protein [Desulfobacterales bacterium]